MSALQIGLLSLGDCLDDPVGGGRPTPAERQRAIVESAVQAERLGFDSAWLGEHPFCDSVLSAPPVVLAAIAARTERLRLGGQLRWPTRNEAKPSEAHPSGTGLTVLANLDPVRAAEDYATLDGISGGRVELVAGRGLLADPDEAFGQETDESRERFRENVELLLRLWTETEVSWSGRFRAPLERVTVEPRPVQQPHPPIWVGGHSPAALRRAVRFGAAWHPINRPPDELRAGRAELRRLSGEHGRGTPPAITLRNDVRVLGPGEPAPASAHAGRVVAGEPAALAEQIVELADCGVEHLVLEFPAADAADLDRQLTLFAERVRPRLG